jgi:hypothetical protein
MTISPQSQWIRLIQIFSAKLVLEVFGAGGAIWGFSEAVTLRTPHTVWFWRPCAAIVGTIFFVRWILQIQDYMSENGMEKFEMIIEQLKRNGCGLIEDDAEHLSMTEDANHRDENDTLLVV